MIMMALLCGNRDCRIPASQIKATSKLKVIKNLMLFAVLAASELNFSGSSMLQARAAQQYHIGRQNLQQKNNDNNLLL